MVKWSINGNVTWLCTACARENVPVFVHQRVEILESSADPHRRCSLCRCTEEVSARLKRWRWIFWGVATLFPWLLPGYRRALRRAR